LLNFKAVTLGNIEVWAVTVTIVMIVVEFNIRWVAQCKVVLISQGRMGVKQHFLTGAIMDVALVRLGGLRYPPH